MSGWARAGIIVGAIAVGFVACVGAAWCLLTYDVETLFKNGDE